MTAALSSLLAVFSYQLNLPLPESGVSALSTHEGLNIALVVHIGCAIAGLTAFAVSAAVSGLYLITARKLKSKAWVLSSPRMPSLSVLDELNLKGLLVGFPLYMR